MNRLKARYASEIKDALVKEFDIKNPMLVPALEKVVISVGAGSDGSDSKILQNIVDTISLISGQKALVKNAKKSVAGFKVREGMPVGVRVTLRGENMYNFFDRLVSIALPRVKDFRGVPRNGFDGRGNYNMGIKEQIIFPEIEYEKIDAIRGMNITITTSAKTDEEAKALLLAFNFPLKK